MAFGHCYADSKRELYVGNPIREAYLLEQSQDWVGGVCAQSCKGAPHFNRVLSDEWRNVVSYPVPTKGDEPVDLAILWCDPVASVIEKRPICAFEYAAEQ